MIRERVSQLNHRKYNNNKTKNRSEKKCDVNVVLKAEEKKNTLCEIIPIFIRKAHLTALDIKMTLAISEARA